MGWVKAGSVEEEVFSSWGSKNFAVDTFDWFAREGKEGGTWDQSSKIDQDWECGRWGRNTRDNMRWAGRGWAQRERGLGVRRWWGGPAV